MNPIWAVGLMTGTVLDGNIDVAMLKTDGERVERFGPYTLAPYPEEINGMLRQAQKEALAWNFDGPEPAIFARAEEALTRAQSAAVRNLVEGSGMGMADIGVVGFHGQTVLHRAPTKERAGDTRQNAPVGGAVETGELGERDEAVAVDAHEAVAELLFELRQRFLDQHLAPGVVDDDVFVFGKQVIDVADGD